MCRRISDSLDEPRPIGAAGDGPLQCCDFIHINLVVAGIDVEDQELPLVYGFHFALQLPLVALFSQANDLRAGTASVWHQLRLLTFRCSCSWQVSAMIVA